MSLSIAVPRRFETMKNTSLWVLMFGALAVLPGQCPAATISLESLSGPVMAGSSFWLNVDVTTGVDPSTTLPENIWAYDFSLQFDPTVLQFLNAQDGGFLPLTDLALASPVWDPYTPGDGSIGDISNSLSGDAPGVSGTGVLVQVQFLALAGSPASIVSPFGSILLDFDLNQLSNVDELGTQVTVLSGAPEPGAFSLLGLGLLGAVMHRLRKGPHRG
jgi:hypothetical protein